MARPPKNGKWQHLNDTGFKQCTTCNVEFPIDEFNIKKGHFYKSNGKPKRQNRCKKCHASASRENYAQNKEYKKKKTAEYNKNVVIPRNMTFVQKYKRIFGKCVKCGETDHRVLDFNHLDQSKKTAGVTQLAWNLASIKRIKNEIKKCEILCANCHRKHTWEQLGWRIYH